MFIEVSNDRRHVPRHLVSWIIWLQVVSRSSMIDERVPLAWTPLRAEALLY